MNKLSRKQWIIIAVVVLIGGAILRSATNSGPTIPKDKTTLVQEQAPVATIGFDKPLDLGGGVSVTISAPTHFTPTQFMTNYDQKAKTANYFTVTIKNGGKTPLISAQFHLKLIQVQMSASISWAIKILTVLQQKLSSQALKLATSTALVAKQLPEIH
jgi:hypothetical protein